MCFAINARIGGTQRKLTVDSFLLHLEKNIFLARLPFSRRNFKTSDSRLDTINYIKKCRQTDRQTSVSQRHWGKMLSCLNGRLSTAPGGNSCVAEINIFLLLIFSKCRLRVKFSAQLTFYMLWWGLRGKRDLQSQLKRRSYFCCC